MQHEIGPPTFCFIASNTGIRPGKDVLVTLEAKGNFEIQPPDRNDAGQDGGDSDKKVELPHPPKPPQGRWTTRFGDHLPNASGSFNALRALQQSLDPLSQITSFEPPRLNIDLPILQQTDHRRDPNGFYWKPDRPANPGESLNLECAQWRHGVEEEYFQVQLFFDRNVVEIKGALECRIHAENLSVVAIKTIPVRIKVSIVNARGRAKELLAELVNRALG